MWENKHRHTILDSKTIYQIKFEWLIFETNFDYLIDYNFSWSEATDKHASKGHDGKSDEKGLFYVEGHDPEVCFIYFPNNGVH